METCETCPRKATKEKLVRKVRIRKKKSDRSIREKSRKTTVADNVEHQTGQDNMYVQRERLSVATVEKGHYEKMCRLAKKIE